MQKAGVGTSPTPLTASPDREEWEAEAAAAARREEKEEEEEEATWEETGEGAAWVAVARGVTTRAAAEVKVV